MADEPADRSVAGDDEPAVLAPDEAEAERAHEREVAREEAERLDELQQRQLRFAAYAWKPPDQGGADRADADSRGADRADAERADDAGPTRAPDSPG